MLWIKKISIRQFPSPAHPYIAFPQKNLAVLDISRFTTGEIGPQSRLYVCILMLNVNGTTLTTDKPTILNMWAEHFSAVLNRPADINAETIARLPQVETNTGLERPPSDEEVKKAIKQLSRG